MIELLCIYFLSKKNSQQALERGHNPIGYRYLTIALWIGMEIIGAIIGNTVGSEFIAYLFALGFAAIGGLISRIIVYNLKQGQYTPKVEVEPLSRPAQITVERQRSYLSSSDVWDFSLNGAYIGRIDDGMSLTFATNQRNNVLTAKSFYGSLSLPFEFSVENCADSKVYFRAGKFESAQSIDKSHSSEPGPACLPGLS